MKPSFVLPAPVAAGGLKASPQAKQLPDVISIWGGDVGISTISACSRGLLGFMGFGRKWMDSKSAAYNDV